MPKEKYNMKIYIKEIINNKIGDNTPFEDVAKSMKFEIVRDDTELETAYDGSLWERGFAPSAPEQSYVQKRIAEYPNITDQLDMIYWDKINGTNIWENTITEIKNKYPKDN